MHVCCAAQRSDTQVVTGKTAEACNGLVMKQLKSAGVPLWQDVVDDLRSQLLACNSHGELQACNA